MQKLAATAGRVAFASLFPILALAVPALGAPLVSPEAPWALVGPKGGGLSNLAAAAGAAGVLWAVIPGQGPSKSIDGGVSWKATSLPQPESYFAVVTDPVDPLTVYAEGTTGLLKTTDGGAVWRRIFPAVSTLGIAAGAPRTLYVANREEFGNPTEISRSDDGGATWRKLPPLPFVANTIFELVVDPTRPDSVYLVGSAFLVDISPPFALHSTDGGQSWSFIEGIPFSLFSLRFDRRAPGTILALGNGVMRSLDGGTTWETVNAGLPPGGLVSSLISDPLTGTFYVSLGIPSSGLGQVWSSSDDGTTWAKVAERAGYLGPLRVDGALPGRLYAGAEDVGLLVSTGTGGWKVANAHLVPPGASEIDPDPHVPGSFYALLFPRGSITSRPNLARSLDGGATWESWIPRDVSGAPVYLSRLVFDPFVAGSIYALSGFAFYHSADGGRTWSIPGAYPPSFSGAASVVADPLHAGVLLAAGPNLNGGSAILRSTNGGQSWTFVLSLPVGETFVDLLVLDPSSVPQTLYAGGHAGFWRSVDGGVSWTPVGLGPDNLPDFHFVTGLEVDAFHNLYAEIAPARPHSLYKSSDGGVSWAPIDSGLPAGTVVRDVLPRGTTLDIATDHGVYVSEDGGGQWTARNAGLPSLSVSQLADGSPSSSPSSDTLLAATDNGLAISPPPSTSCVPSETVLCLENGRFALRIHWALANGTAGDAHASPLTEESGGFWFFSPESVELVVKAIDGQGVNGRFWIFGGALTNVAYTLTVTEVSTGFARAYTNPQGRLASFADTDAFAATGDGHPEVRTSLAPVVPFSQTKLSPSPGCNPAADTLCLADSRFAVRVAWQLPSVPSTSATAVPLFQNTGAFWFFGAGNLELIVKILDGQAVNGHFWVFFAGLSGVDYTATVTDTATGTTKTYHHPAGALASSADTGF
jgi:photosystem II stability/assembly factor-like uncharacterized protein